MAAALATVVVWADAQLVCAPWRHGAGYPLAASVGAATDAVSAARDTSAAADTTPARNRSRFDATPMALAFRPVG
jgi:hypothetical protein